MANIKLQQSQQGEKSTSLVVMWVLINQNPLGRSGLSPREGWLKKETTGEEEEKEMNIKKKELIKKIINQEIKVMIPIVIVLKEITIIELDIKKIMTINIREIII